MTEVRMKLRSMVYLKQIPPLVIALCLIVINLQVEYSMSFASNTPLDVVATTNNTIEEPFPITPPDNSKISIGEPNVDGNATVTGADGAVPGGAAVAIINLNSRNTITTTANSKGGFEAELFAPPGSALLVKYDLIGDRVDQLWNDAFLASPPDLSYMNPLPGAIVSVGTLPLDNSLSQPFQSSGYFGGDAEWAGWWITGSAAGPSGGDLHVQNGNLVTIHGSLHITSPALSCTDPNAYNPMINFHLRYLFDEAGQSYPWGIWFNSHLFTPTGLPIEHEANGETRGVVSTNLANLSCQSTNTLAGDFDTNFTVPNDLPDGYYQIEAYLNQGGVPLALNVPRSVVWYQFEPMAFFPFLTVGSPATPHIPWTLFGNYPINGHRGVQAQEDVGHYEMPTRVLLPPNTPIIPMLDERSGDPIRYRLEPGSHWISATDRRMPNPPRLPLVFPAGQLTAEIHKPDGTTTIIGPASIKQTSIRTPTTPEGAPIDQGTGHIGDLYHLYTGVEAFAYSFDQYGAHTIILSGEVQDIYGHIYPITGTYEFLVARVLDLDPAQLPMTPYQQGDAFAPGLHIFPPVSAEVELRITQLPNSNPNQAIENSILGTANRYGYFQPPVGTEIRLVSPGEFRVDINAVYEALDGTLWAGSMTWGNVIEGPSTQIEAHGRRGMDFHNDTISNTPTWFRVFDLPQEKVGIEVYYPYLSGDIHWGNEDRAPGDSIHSVITVKDKGGIDGNIYNIMRANYPRARNGFRWPPDDTSSTGLEKRLAVGEAPLFITTTSGIDAAVSPGDIDQFAYWYGSSERPDVRVREIISEDNMGTAYWRFDDTYGYQIGEPADGDKPGDLKWEFGGAVFRLPGQGINEYAIYSSLWVLLPHGCDPYGCARVTTPFQDATGAGINGGPIMSLLGKDVDMLFLPKGVRPGDVLEVGDTIAFSGHVGPPLDSRVELTITSPTGVVRSRTWHANKIGWLYDPTFDFTADEAGRWTVNVFVEHDRPYIGNGMTPTSHNTGTVLGTNGQYEFYVVQPASAPLMVTSPHPGFIPLPAGAIDPIVIRGVAPPGTTNVHYTIHDKGIVMRQGSLTPNANGLFTLGYNPVVLHENFSMLSLTAHEGQRLGLADEVSINLLAVGSQPNANTITLIGEEIFVGSLPRATYLPVVLNP
jgi:hypothetical protein